MTYAQAKIDLMLQDENLGTTGRQLIEHKELRLDDDTYDRFLDGPTCRRVAVVDFDPATGAPLPAPAKFIPGRSTPTRGRFITDTDHRDSPEFLAVNAFGTVFETIRMFEEPGALGRRVKWAFDGQQLLVVPRAGEWANAFYDRATRSLQFFWFNAGEDRIYTALSRDIVAHECGHALLDAVVPSLFDASTPESLAIHEGIADLVAVLMALRSGELRQQVLASNDNDIANATVFSSIAERFGAARPRPDEPHPHALRDLRNSNTMQSLRGSNPHTLSTVLSAVFYDFLIDMYDHLKQKLTMPSPQRPALGVDAAANRSLGSAAIIFRRLLLRGIDYLPPGDLTFADVARATLAADDAADPDGADDGKNQARQQLAQRFVDRGIVASLAELQTEAPAELSVAPEELADIRDSDWRAYRYVDKHREALRIPAGTTFRVLPRVDATKEVGVPVDGHYTTQRELLLKVSWDVVEDNGAKVLPAPKRRVRTGVTIAYRWKDGRVLACVGSNVTNDVQREARDEFLTKLFAGGHIKVVKVAAADAPPTGAADTEVRILGDVARITGTQRLLHIAAID